MERLRAKRLREALAAAALINTMMQDQTLEGFLADEWFRSAVERKLEIIGEALNSVRRMDPAISERFPTIHEWPALRNALSHVYFEIDNEVIWVTATRGIPDLIDTLNMLLVVDGNENER
ncbi:MAG: DUF86 domain-containing protein [Chloroflexia bacterium]|nr:DUF86 domain-containing protein [Chloroflexia bacterium]